MEASGNDGRPGRILVVDDEPALGGYLARVLRSGGHDVVHELSSEDALGRIHAEQWDLLITDIELPGMSGLELLERTREIAPGLPVALLTGRPSVDYAVTALRGAAAEFLLKPVSRDDLARESREAADAIGARLFLRDLEDTRVSEGNPTIGLIEEVVTEVQPTIVYTHSVHDLHRRRRAPRAA
jgi:DNA-binding NtrC family response regulator